MGAVESRKPNVSGRTFEIVIAAYKYKRPILMYNSSTKEVGIRRLNLHMGDYWGTLDDFRDFFDLYFPGEITDPSDADKKESGPMCEDNKSSSSSEVEHEEGTSAASYDSIAYMNSTPSSFSGIKLNECVFNQWAKLWDLLKGEKKVSGNFPSFPSDIECAMNYEGKIFFEETKKKITDWLDWLSNATDANVVRAREKLAVFESELFDCIRKMLFTVDPINIYYSPNHFRAMYLLGDAVAPAKFLKSCITH
jgi:hypothetical protein